MALAAKREDMRHVPWFSLAEWYRVYEQIYSNSDAEQCEAYATLVAWKIRIPKLPVGIDCTLAILQVCLRDREWTPKINNNELPIDYENDLNLMYSTTIMRFLNHISNIGHTKQTSLFQIARQLKIPEWVVNLRHDVAHGQKLPSIGVLRMAVNILLIWLHDEYWAAEAKNMEDYYIKETNMQETNEDEELQAFTSLFELWTAVSLYRYAGYKLVTSIPDMHLRDMLEDLRTYALSLTQDNSSTNCDKRRNYMDQVLQYKTGYKLSKVQIILLEEISQHLGKTNWLSKKEDLVLQVLLDSVAFLPNISTLKMFSKDHNPVDILNTNELPVHLIQFWQDIMLLLQERGLLTELIFKLLNLVENKHVVRHKKIMAALWIRSIVYAFFKLNIAQNMCQVLENKIKNTKKSLHSKKLHMKIKADVDQLYPNLQYTLYLPITSALPCYITDINFVYKLITKANEFSIMYIPPILELVTPKLCENKQKQLLKLIEIYAVGIHKNENENTKTDNTEYTVEHLHKIFVERNVHFPANHSNMLQESFSPVIGDTVIRNSDWKLASDNYQWSVLPIGVLPWQTDLLEILEPLKLSSKHNIADVESQIVPGMVDMGTLKMQSQINWNTVLRKRKRLKRKSECDKVIIDRAIQVVKKQK